MKQMLKRLWRHNILFLSCSIAGVLFIASAPEAQQPTTSSSSSQKEDLLELPSFTPTDTPTTKTPTSLELLPDEKKQSAPKEQIKPNEKSPISAYSPKTPPLTATPEKKPAKPVEPPAVPPPAVAPSATQESSPPTTPTTVVSANTEPEPLVPTEPEQDIIPDGWNEGSLMFSAIELQKLREALLSPPPIAVADTTALPLGSAAGAAAPPPVVDYAAFYVNSILYHGKKKWSVWLNGRKFFPKKESPLERITLKKVSDNRIVFLWVPANKMSLPEKFDKRYIRLKKDGSVLITLSTNQTLLTGTFDVFEGRGLTQEIRKLLAENTTQAQQKPLPAQSSIPLSNHTENSSDANVNTLISQHRNAEKNAANTKTMPPTSTTPPPPTTPPTTTVTPPTTTPSTRSTPNPSPPTS